MKREELNEKKQKVTDFKTAAKDMQTVAEELRKLPKGQYKKLWGNEILTAIWERYGVI